ncbi:MAG: DUF502 domain-containing protein [Haloplanus sp.]
MVDLSSRSRRSLGQSVREAFVTGLAVVVPALGTVLLFAFVVDWIYRYLDRLSSVLPVNMVPGMSGTGAELLVELAVPVALLAGILWVGFLVEGSQYGELAVEYVDTAVTSIPGVGPVYESFRRMSDVVLDEDTENFREVKLVEFPERDVYTIGFLTASTPDTLQEPTGHDGMQTLFLPMAPNPVMGGHLVHVPDERVYDVEMTVEEGVRAVLTSGVGVAGGEAREDGLEPDRLRDIGRTARAEQRLHPETDPSVSRHDDESARAERYADRAAAEDAATPADLAERRPDRERE